MKRGVKKSVSRGTLKSFFIIALALFHLLFAACAGLDETPFERRVKAIIILAGTATVFIIFIIVFARLSYMDWKKEKEEKGDKE